MSKKTKNQFLAKNTSKKQNPKKENVLQEVEKPKIKPPKNAKKMKLFRFHFNTPLHLGNARADYDSSENALHSDTLYSAIIHAWSVLGIDIPDYTKQDLGFTLSSLFPFYQKEKNSECLYFFPKPTGKLLPKDYGKHKDIKKIQYLDQIYFQQCLEQGDILDMESKADNIKGAYFSQNKDFDASFMQKKVYPRTRISRTGADDTEIYYIERIFFTGKSGLFCLFEGSDEVYQKVKFALEYLQSEGIGTDRHVGNGLFELEEANVFLASAENSDYCVNLSLFCPENEVQLNEMIDKNSKWELLKRGGWITQEPFLSYRKNSVYMFKEASIFKMPDDKKGVFSLGKTVDLKPDIIENQPIFRVGKSLFLGIKN